MKRPLRYLGDQVLRRPAREVECPEAHQTTSWLACLIADMRDTMEIEGGIGLAAPQIGVSLRVIVTEDRALVNPRIVWSGTVMTSMVEGCLSIPGSLVAVLRPRRVRVEAYDADQHKYVTINAKDMEARVLQHEIDHLDGKLITDHRRLEP